MSGCRDHSTVQLGPRYSTTFLHTYAPHCHDPNGLPLYISSHGRPRAPLLPHVPRTTARLSPQSHVLVVLAAGGLVVKVGLLALLVRLLGERRLLVLGLCAYACECVALALASTKTEGLLAVSLGSVASVCWPSLVALQTSGVAPGQQGAVFGALQGISSMASGLGPLVYAWVFREVSRADSDWSVGPGAVWFLAAGMTVVAVVITTTLPKPHVYGEREGEQEGEREGEREGEEGRREGEEDVEAGRDGEEGRRSGEGVRESLLG